MRAFKNCSSELVPGVRGGDVGFVDQLLPTSQEPLGDFATILFNLDLDDVEKKNRQAGTLSAAKDFCCFSAAYLTQVAEQLWL